MNFKLVEYYRCLLKALLTHLLEFRLRHHLAKMYPHLMDLSRIIHSQWALIKELDSVISLKRGLVGEEGNEERLDSVISLKRGLGGEEGNKGRPKKKAKFSVMKCDMESQLEEAERNVNYNENGACGLEEDLHDLKKEISEMKEMIYNLENPL